MNTTEAINLLDSVTAQISLNRADHVKVQEAIAVLKTKLKEEKENGTETNQDKA